MPTLYDVKNREQTSRITRGARKYLLSLGISAGRMCSVFVAAMCMCQERGSGLSSRVAVGDDGGLGKKRVPDVTLI